MPITIRNDIQSLETSIIETRRDIHQHPELAFNEVRTANLVATRLRALGIDVEEKVGKTGVVGRLHGDKPGPEIALRADMDALPMQEIGDIPYRSVNDGVMHACGHDGHTAMLLGAAEALFAAKDELHGTVRFIFQPAEEGHHGAKFMLEDGALQGVEEIYGLHLWNYQPYGTVGVQAGPVMACSDSFDITITGVGGHGAAPQGTVDAVVVSAHLITSLQTIVSRNNNPLESAVVSIGQINGGHNFNIIADKVELRGTARSYTTENQELIIKQMNQIISGIAQTFGASIELDYRKGYPATINAPAPTEKTRIAAQKIAGDGVMSPYLSMGGEDFSYFANEVPGCYFFIGSAPNDRPAMSVPHHCSHFDIDERALLVGASIYTQIALDCLKPSS